MFVISMRKAPLIYSIGIVMVLLIPPLIISTEGISDPEVKRQEHDVTRISLSIEYDTVREYQDGESYLRVVIEDGGAGKGPEGIFQPYIPLELRIPGEIDDLSVEFGKSHELGIQPTPWISPALIGISSGEIHPDWDGSLDSPSEAYYTLTRLSAYKWESEKGWVYSLKIYPVCHPDGETTLIHTDVDISYTYTPSARSSHPWISLHKPLGDVDYLVITDRSLSSSIMPLVNHKSSKGLLSMVTATEDIYDMYDTGDKAEKMRKYVQDMEDTFDLDYLLIVGDYDLVPTRLTYNPYPCNMMGVNEPSNFASDSYFACVDRGTDWNKDGDGRIGEHNDFDDVIPDLAVGRLAINDGKVLKKVATSLIDREVNRTITGEENIQVHIAGDPGMNPGSPTSVMDYFWDTYGKDEFPGHDTMYYDGTGNLTYSTSSFLDMLEEHHQYMGYFAHGQFENIPNLVDRNDIANMDGVGPSGIFFAMACVNGMFDDPSQGNIGGTGDCFAEAMTETPNKGVVGYMAASRLAVGSIDTSYSGDAPGLMEDYWRAVNKAIRGEIRNTSGDIFRAAQTNFASSFYPFPNNMYDGAHRTFLEYNLLGDPEAPVILEENEELRMDWNLGPDKDWIEVEVTDSIGDPVPSAKITLFKEGELGIVSVADQLGYKNITIPSSNGGNVQLSAYRDGYSPVVVHIDLPDTLDPIALLKMDPAEPDGDNGYYITSPNMTIYSDEPVNVEYHWVGQEMTVLPGPVSVFGIEGNHTLEYRVIDTVGHSSEWMELDIDVDMSPPELSIKADPSVPDGNDGVYLTSPTLTLLSNEEMVSPYWRVDSRPWQIYTEPVNIEEGSHTVSFKASDPAGNQNETNEEFVIDLSYPVTGLIVSHQPTGNDGYYLDPPKISLSVPGETGRYLEYRWDEGNWNDYTDDFEPPEGIHFLEYRACDMAGNLEPTRNRTFKVDTKLPSFNVSVSPSAPDGRMGLYTTTPTVEIISEDGVIDYILQRGEGSPDWEEAEDYYYPINIPDGDWSLYTRATDHAGNMKLADPMSFHVDTSAPELEWHLDPPSPNGANGWYTVNPLIVLENITMNQEVSWRLNVSSIWVDADERIKIPEGITSPSLRITDPAGNSRTYTVGRLMVDPGSPDVTLMTPVDGSEHGGGIIEMAWDGNDSISGIDEYFVRLDTGGWESHGISKSTRIGPFDSGTHVIGIKAVDGSGWSKSVLIYISVDADQPYVLTWSPTGDNVSLDSVIKMEFSERMDRDNTSLRIEGLNGSLEWSDNRIVYYPDSQLLDDTEYQVVVSGSDLYGNGLEPFSWSFHTTIVETPDQDVEEGSDSNMVPILASIAIIAVLSVVVLVAAVLLIMRRIGSEE